MFLKSCDRVTFITLLRQLLFEQHRYVFGNSGDQLLSLLLDEGFQLLSSSMGD